jgi:ATP-binding cassette subfamily G (WHITE) protein 2 (PDR)
MQAVVYPPLVFQIIPVFAANRELYEVRERASKTYAWPAFLIAQSIAEIPYQILMGCIVFIVWNYTVLGIQSSEQQGLVLLFMVQFFVWAGTVAQMAISAIPLPEVAGMVSIILFVLSLLFAGVIQPPTVMPHFWRFLWRVSPLAHWTAGIAATGLHGRNISCAAAEFATFQPADNSTCGTYLNRFLNEMHAPGYLLQPDATSNCQYCGFSTADQILAQSSIFWSDRWTNLGYGMAYIVFNIFMTVVLYKVFRLGGLGSKIKARREMVLGKVRAKFAKK